MKKVLILAVAALLGTSAYSQDVFKQISKIKDYNEAANLLKSNLGTLSAEQKAKCYNALVDLAYNKVVKEQGTITSNQMAEQLKTNIEPVDTVGLYNAALNAIESAVACDEFDNQPNDKGKVKPKFHKANGDRLYPIRFHLINGGIYFQGKDGDKLSSKFLSTYVDSNDYPLFAEQDKSKDANLGQIAFYASRFAYFDKEYAKAEKYADIALNDTSVAKDAMNIKLAVMQAQLKSHEDSLNYVSKLKELYSKDENNEVVFSTLCQMLINLNDKAGQESLIAEKLQKDPNNFTALAMTGQSYMTEHKWDEAIDYLTKASAVQPKNVVVVALIGQSYMYKAQEAANRAAGKSGRIAPAAEKQIIDVYNTAMSYLEKARDMDTRQEFKSSWAYALYSCAYRTLGEDDAKTKEYKSYIE